MECADPSADFARAGSDRGRRVYPEFDLGFSPAADREQPRSRVLIEIEATSTPAALIDARDAVKRRAGGDAPWIVHETPTLEGGAPPPPATRKKSRQFVGSEVLRGGRHERGSACRRGGLLDQLDETGVVVGEASHVARVVELDRRRPGALSHEPL